MGTVWCTCTTTDKHKDQRGRDKNNSITSASSTDGIQWHKQKIYILPIQWEMRGNMHVPSRKCSLFGFTFTHCARQTKPRWLILGIHSCKTVTRLCVLLCPVSQQLAHLNAQYRRHWINLEIDAPHNGMRRTCPLCAYSLARYAGSKNYCLRTTSQTKQLELKTVKVVQLSVKWPIVFFACFEIKKKVRTEKRRAHHWLMVLLSPLWQLKVFVHITGYLT